MDPEYTYDFRVVAVDGDHETPSETIPVYTYPGPGKGGLNQQPMATSGWFIFFLLLLLLLFCFFEITIFGFFIRLVYWHDVSCGLPYFVLCCCMSDQKKSGRKICRTRK